LEKKPQASLSGFDLMAAALARPAASGPTTVVCFLDFSSWLGHEELLLT
jgi:hypothetical protein